MRAEGGDGASSFEALWAVVVTWVNVPPYPADRTTFFKCAQLGASFSEACDDTNSYQVILTTDGSNSFFITEYQCEFMKWSGNVANAIVGFSVPEHYGTHQFSGRNEVSDIGCYDRNGNAISRNVSLEFNFNYTEYDYCDSEVPIPYRFRPVGVCHRRNTGPGKVTRLRWLFVY